MIHKVFEWNICKSLEVRMMFQREYDQSMKNLTGQCKNHWQQYWFLYCEYLNITKKFSRLCRKTLFRLKDLKKR